MSICKKHLLKNFSKHQSKRLKTEDRKINSDENEKLDYPSELIAEDNDVELENLKSESDQMNVFTVDESTISNQFKSYFSYRLLDKEITQLQRKYITQETFSWEVFHHVLFMSRSDSSLQKSTLISKPISNPVLPEQLTENFGINKLLAKNWPRFRKHHLGFTPLQSEIFTILHQYRSLYYPCWETVDEENSTREAYCLHALNHIVKSRARVMKNNRLLSKLSPKEAEAGDYRDQGFTRPKVLILVPFRSVALKIVDFFIQLLKSEKKFDIGNVKRFHKEFNVDKSEEEQAFDLMRLKKKPSDYQRIFSGNTDEHFRLGISLLSHTFRLYAPFYSSDIIISSPLGLRTVIGEKGESNYEYDFLSSVEMCILDNADTFLMQNWEHVIHIFKHLHLRPKEAHDVDFSRVRNSALNGDLKHYCQTAVFSSVSLPQISSLLTKYCFNHRGLIMVQNVVEKGAICGVTYPLPQVYHRVDAAGQPFSEIQNIRFKFFVQQILKQIIEKEMKRVLIYLPQYFDYVRLRNYMRRKSKSGVCPQFVFVCEYMDPSAVKKSRKKFLSNEASILLYTERYHFYNRPKLRGIGNLIFYELPTFPHFYRELCNMVHVSEEDGLGSNSIVTVYSKYDSTKLLAVLGSKRSRELLRSQKSVHLFLSETNPHAVADE